MNEKEQSGITGGLHRRILEILSGPESQQDSELDRLCAEHPEHSAAIRRDLREAGELADAMALECPTATAGMDLSELVSALPSHPESIGPYRIVEVLGEGGMGSVYLAEQERPVRRRVALKVIKLGMDSKQVLARFALERQALAVMNHEAIAKVFEAGATDRGQPYFVMEFVEGTPITKYCDDRRITIAERIRIFQQVCAGVQHAHQKGVLHRDLKPGNILVSCKEDQHFAKIIDFGLARATDAQLGIQTIYTEQGRLIGTPEYMSPEQTTGSSGDIDTRTDIYSLGVVLYELLSGELPFPSSALRRAGELEIQRIIREEDPPKPSARVSVDTVSTSSAAGSRRMSTSTFRRALRGDLDWIVMKAMAKEPEHRYASATNLSMDLQRYLDHEPVEAGPPSRVYQLRKLVRRHRGTVTAIVLTVALLAFGLAGTLWQYRVADRRGREAQANLKLYDDLHDLPLARDLIAMAEDRMWPAIAAIGEFQQWLEQADGIAARAVAHRKRLAELRRRALPEPAEISGLRDELDELRARRAALETTTPTRATLRDRDQLDGRIAALSGEIDDLRWRFDSDHDRLQHGILTELVRALDRLTTTPDGLIAKVRQRLGQAESHRARCIDEHRELWRQAAAAIASADGRSASTRYAGTGPIPPQPGLVPLGIDPDTRLWEFAVLDSGELPARDPTGRLRTPPSFAIVLVLLPGGASWMGSQGADRSRPNYDPQSGKDESDEAGRPVRAELDPFFISRFELTQGQWLRIAGSNPSEFRAGAIVAGRQATREHPVENVSFNACVRVLRRLGLELPTEAQWEYAARGGSALPWWFGDDADAIAGRANVADRTLRQADPKLGSAHEAQADGWGLPARVDAGQPNAFGLHFVAGNVAEWTRDGYRPHLVQARPGDGYQGHPGVLERVCRGGSFDRPVDAARSARRASQRKSLSNPGTGVRPVRRLLR